MCILCILVYFGCKKSPRIAAEERTHIIIFARRRAKELRGKMDDVRGKRRCFVKTYARGMQGGLINIWILLRVCNVFTLAKVKSQRAVALGKFHSIDDVDGLPRGPEIQERVRRGLHQVPRVRNPRTST